MFICEKKILFRGLWAFPEEEAREFRTVNIVATWCKVTTNFSMSSTAKFSYPKKNLGKTLIHSHWNYSDSWFRYEQGQVRLCASLFFIIFLCVIIVFISLFVLFGILLIVCPNLLIEILSSFTGKHFTGKSHTVNSLLNEEAAKKQFLNRDATPLVVHTRNANGLTFNFIDAGAPTDLDTFSSTVSLNPKSPFPPFWVSFLSNPEKTLLPVCSTYCSRHW